MRPLVPAGALVLLCAATPALATPASAAVAAAPASGVATSVAQLVSLTAGGHVVDVATLELLSDMLGASPAASVILTPLAVDGQTFGQQVVTPASGPASIPALPSAVLPGLLSVVSPVINASATTPSEGPRSTAGATSLGSINVLGLDVVLDGAASAVTGVTDSVATATKTASITDLALPSIADLLAGLGIDVSLLPIATLQDLVDQLGLAVSGALASANAALDSVQAQVTAATATLTTATAQLDAATTAADSALATLQAALAGSGLSPDAFAALPVFSQELIPAAAAALPAYVATLSTKTAAEDALALAQAAVDALQATLAAAVAAVLDAVTAVLDGTPLLSLDAFEVSTKAVATSAQPGGQEADVVGGALSGLTVLGTDVLDAVLGSSSVDLLDVTDEVLAEVGALVDDLTGTLSDVLSQVAGLTVTAPVVDVLGSTTRTGVVGGFGEAENGLSALSLTLPRVTVPTSLSLPGIGALPAFEGVSAVDGALSSLAGSVDLVTLTELSRFKPAVVAGPGSPAAPTVSPTLPQTGAPGGLAALATALVAVGLVARRRLGLQGETA